MPRGNEGKEKSGKKAPTKNLKEKRAAKNQKREEKSIESTIRTAK